jgi:hypothetical protein
MNGYLSPYIPGLKRLDIFDESGHDSGDMVARGSFDVSFDSGGFSFEGNNAAKYAFEFLLLDAPTGVSLTAKSYLERTVTIADDTPNKSSFSIQIKAYAIAHPDEPCYSAPFLFYVYNPAGGYAVDGLPGLTSISLLVNGVSTEEQFLTPGDYALSLKCEPEDYLDSFNASVTYFYPSSGSDVSFNGTTLTISSTIPELPYCMEVIIKNDWGSHVFSFPLAVKNTRSTGNTYNFPSLRGIYLTYQGNPCLRSDGGNYDIDIGYVMDDGVLAAFDSNHWLLRVAWKAELEEATFDFDDPSGPIHLSIPSCPDDQYVFGYFSVQLSPKTDPNSTFSSAIFYVLLGA